MPKVTLDPSGQLSRTGASTGMSVGWRRESSGDFLVRVSAYPCPNLFETGSFNSSLRLAKFEINAGRRFHGHGDKE